MIYTVEARFTTQYRANSSDEVFVRAKFSECGNWRIDPTSITVECQPDPPMNTVWVSQISQGRQVVANKVHNSYDAAMRHFRFCVGIPECAELIISNISDGSYHIVWNEWSIITTERQVES